MKVFLVAVIVSAIYLANAWNIEAMRKNRERVMNDIYLSESKDSRKGMNYRENEESRYLDEKEIKNDAAYNNDFDKDLNFQCPQNQVLSAITSVHNNYYEDRKFAFSCQPSKLKTESYWTNYLNNFDQKFIYECKNGYALTGFKSIHNNHFEDRRWRVKCTQLDIDMNEYYKKCYWNKRTTYDAEWTIKVPANKYATGLRAYHDNYFEDREYSLRLCTYNQYHR